MKSFDSTMGARFPNPRVTERYGADTMPETGDNVAREFGVTREQADRFAAASQANYARAKTAGFHAGEILPVPVPTGRRTPPLQVSEDEHPRPASDLGALARL
jgi:acetyl-CoA C-acetyltransferase